MSVVSVREIPERSDNEQIGSETTKKRVWHVKTDNAYDEWSTIQLHPAFPAKWSRHERNNRLILQEYDCEQMENSAFLWKVTANYSTKVEPGSPLESMSQGYTPEQTENPLDRPAQIRWDYSFIKKPTDKADFVGDFQGNQDQSISLQNNIVKAAEDVEIANSAGVPVIPPLEFDDTSLVIVATKNIAKPYEWMVRLKNRVNDGDFRLDGLVWKRGRLRFLPKLGPVQMDKDYVYRELTMEFHYLEDGWDQWVLDQGLSQKIKTQDKDGKEIETLQRFLDSNGELVENPVLLDGKGGRLPAKEKAHYRVYRPYKFRSFSDLEPFLR